MNKYIRYLFVVLAVCFGFTALYFFDINSAVLPTITSCTEEVRICFDGSAVVRSGTRCEFAPCPSSSLDSNIDVTKNPPKPISETPLPIVCTMEAKICPDGSAVGRVGPACEFSLCPAVSVDSIFGKICKDVDDCGTGYECVDLSPVVREGVPLNLRCSRIGAPRPRCLSGETKISTPDGDAFVKNLKVGMSVWSVDVSGKKIKSTIILSGKTFVPKTHMVMHIVLGDGRYLFVSPEHKVADGRMAGVIRVNDRLDQSIVIKSELVMYTEKYTYDILPSSETGMYFANDILLQSTLK